MTTWLCGLERRWTMAAPACFVTTFRRNLENELPHDTEQCPPRAIALGLDHADFLAAMAPKPVIILAKERDYFDVRGSLETFARLKHLYTLLGQPDNIALHIGPTEHGYSQENREAMYRWFNRVTGISDATKEPALTIEKDEMLQCTPRGQVAAENARTVFTFTAEKSKALAASRGNPAGDELKRRIAEVLKLPEASATEPPPDYRILRPVRDRKYPRPGFTTYAVETEPEAFALVTRLADSSHLSRPPQDDPRTATLYVSHHSADAELRTEPLVKELLEAAGRRTVLCLRPPRHRRVAARHLRQRPVPLALRQRLFLRRPRASCSTGRTSARRRTTCSGFSTGSPRSATGKIHLAAKGWGTIPATFAAVLSDRVNASHAQTGPRLPTRTSPRAENYKWPLSCLAPGILAHFDLPDCYRALEADKKLRQIEPQGAVPLFV